MPDTETDTETDKKWVGFIELCGAVQTAQALTQTQITIEPIVVSTGVCVGVGVDDGVGQCERIIKVKVVGRQQDRLLLYILFQLKLSHVEDRSRSVLPNPTCFI